MSEDVSRDVDQLLRDREKYESWLERLEAEKDKATSQAYDRVRSDYQKRLGEVVAQLKAHGEALRNRLSDVEGRVSELEGQREGCQEKLDEARLRRMVGEFTNDPEWQELEGRLVSELEEADRQLGEARSEIHHLNEIVSQVDLDHAEPLARAKACSS
jgi:predicted  nucleic acid-binding Zn-ribbon protein